MSPAQRIEPHLGQAPVQNLALCHQVLNRAGDVLDWDFRVNTMLIEEVDAIGAESLERPLDRTLDVIRLAVETRTPLTGLEIDVPAELGRDHNLVAERRNALTQDTLAFERSISLSGVKEGYAAIIGGADDVDHLRTVRNGRLILAAHVLDAEPDR